MPTECSSENSNFGPRRQKSSPGMGFFSTLATDSRGESDKIAPLHYFDNGLLWRSFVLYSLFVFDSVLDAKILYHSLDRLVRKDGWWKLGARLRKNKSGCLEYRIPERFTPDRPAVAYSHANYHMSSTIHPVASQIPRASSCPRVVGNPDSFHDLMVPSGAPKNLKDYLHSDRPQLGLYIVTFNDMTLVTIYWPHTLMDAMGKKALLDAWCQVLNGKEDEVKPPHGAEIDPLATLGTAPTERHMLASQQMGIFELMSYGFRAAMEFFRRQENRMVCVPQTFVDKLRREAIASLTSTQSKQSDPRPFLSESDVMCAWWTRLAVQHLPPTSAQTIVLNNAYDVRKVLTRDLVPAKAIYISNAIGFINVLLTVKDITEKPLGHVAQSIRTAITQLGTREQVEAFYSLVRQSSGNLPPFFGNRNMHMITFSNWTKANLFHLDFSSALSGGSTSPVARPRYIQNNQFGLTLPNGFPIMGKDLEGNYWLSGYMNKAHWENIESLLADRS